MQEIIDFLRELKQNNNKVWFDANKARYQRVQAQWHAFCEELIREVGVFDPAIARLSVRDCTYRIYRDTRFSADKTPYKTHFGVFLCTGGKKSMHAGYYFHVSTGECDQYPDGHMLGAGNYCYDKAAVNVLREDIAFGWEEFRNDVLGAADPRFVPETEGALKKVPRGFDPASPAAEWLKMKVFGLNAFVADDFVLAPQLAQRVAAAFRTTKPFVDYVNRAVDYAAGRLE